MGHIVDEITNDIASYLRRKLAKRWSITITPNERLLNLNKNSPLGLRHCENLSILNLSRGRIDLVISIRITENEILINDISYDLADPNVFRKIKKRIYKLTLQ